MVNDITQTILKITLTACLFLVFNIQAAERASPIQVNIQKKKLEYGKSLRIEIKTLTKENINIPSLLKPLSDNFSYSVTRSTTGKQYTLHNIKLSPLQTGDVQVPSLYYKQYKTQSVNINMTPPLSKIGQPVLVKLERINLTPWVREQTRIVATVITTDKNIVLNNKKTTNKGSESYLIPQSTKKVIKNNQIFYEYRIGWNVFFLYQQKVNMDLPVIEYIKDGVPKYKFHFRKTMFNVKQLPIYVNPTIPVGEISLSAHYLELPETLLQPNMTAIIQYSLTGNGIPAKWLPSLSQKYLVIRNAKINFSHITTKIETKMTNNNIIGSKVSDIAFTPHSNGMLPIENIQLQYFEPKTGLLKAVSYTHKPLLVLHWFLEIILLLLIFTGGYLFISKILSFSMQRFKKYKHQMQCRSKIRQATTFSDIRAAFQEFSLAENWPVNITLNQWFYHVQNKYKTPDNLQTICNSLNQNMYAMNYPLKTGEIEATKTSLLNILKHLKKKPRKLKMHFNQLKFS